MLASLLAPAFAFSKSIGIPSLTFVSVCPYQPLNLFRIKRVF